MANLSSNEHCMSFCSTTSQAFVVYHPQCVYCVQDTLDEIRIGETLVLRGLKPCGRYEEQVYI